VKIPLRLLTFDLEDWYHILDHPETELPAQWERYPSRIEANTDRILEWLRERRIRSTWFVLGWVAERYPSLVRRIAKEHEIAAHGYAHQLVYRTDRKGFREDTLRCLDAIRQTTGQDVSIYRAGGFSVTQSTPWVFEELAAYGIRVDASLFPAYRLHGGLPGLELSRPFSICGEGWTIREFPLTFTRLAGRKLVYSGGGYFRLLPYPLIRHFTRSEDYTMTYFHPRDFDAEQPVLASLPLKRRWMSYTGLRRSSAKFSRYLRDFDFLSVGEAERQIDWSAQPVRSHEELFR
jgi:polysaccharide deacetylase family protein (PEP-CTERM system associated)